MANVRNSFRVETASGNYWVTEMNCDIATATDYFLHQVREHVTECELTGRETRDKIIKVTQCSSQ